MRILYVENHETFARTVIAEFMQDHAVTLASSIAEALGKLSSESFELGPGKSIDGAGEVPHFGALS